ncbi:MAG: hypothetical protein JO131_10555, partial [Gammaproteobacteria bacterium]|nr:hypothetical protein [Gammaproteobacteria bacterium]
VPIIVDSTLDKFTELYTSAAQFVKKSYQTFSGSTEYSKKKYENIESVMLDLDFKEHVRELYKHLDPDQQLVYSAITRDLFNEYFKFNQDKTIRSEILPAKYNKILDEKTKQDIVKKDIDNVRKKLCESSDKKPSDQIDVIIKEQNTKLKTCLITLTEKANQQSIRSSMDSKQVQSDPIKIAHEYCQVFHATSQGVALVSHLTGNHRLAHQVTQSVAGASHIVMGIAQIAAKGWAAGPVGMIFGGMNTLVSCFGSDSNDSGMEAIAEQLAIISKQIHALHEDMLLQFGKVFTALGIINTNIIQGFRQLHEDQMNILTNVIKLQKSVSVLQDNMNMLGYKIDTLSSDLQGYILEDDRKQLQLVLNEIREKSKRSFSRLKLHPQAIAAFKTFNEELINKKISDTKVSAIDVSKSLTTKLGSAEANTGLLLNYAKNYIGLTVKKPIADPVQWQQTTDLLIEMVEKTSEEKGNTVIGEQDYKDFQYLKTIGENWLAVIEQFQISPDRVSKLTELFQRYKHQITHLVKLIEKEIGKSEQEAKSLMPKFQGYDELKKQQEFKFDFKRNNYYFTFTEEWSPCKGFHHAPRFLGNNYGFAGEWEKHLEGRKSEIIKKLDVCKLGLDAFYSYYKSDKNIVFFFKKSEHRYFSSVFMLHETEHDKMPLLPLPYQNYLLSDVIPEVFITAEMLGIGQIKHLYNFKNNEFIYKIHFQCIEEEKPIVICEYKKSCVVPNYLNPAEAVWHAYMGGTYPNSGSYTSLQFRSQYNNPNGDYGTRDYCALPTLIHNLGLRHRYSFALETPVFKASSVTEEFITHKVKQKKSELRHTMNERIIQQLESLDSRNEMATALLEMDASAKILIAFLSILFRDNYERPVSIWTRDNIIDFLKNYKNQDVYLTHQFETNLIIVDSVEKIFLEKLNLQTEIAYTPVKNTLNKLTHFIEKYEKNLLKDSELA